MKRLVFSMIVMFALVMATNAQTVETFYPSEETDSTFLVKVTMTPKDYKEFKTLQAQVQKSKAQIGLVQKTPVNSPTGAQSALLGKELCIGNALSTIKKSHIDMNKILCKYLSKEQSEILLRRYLKKHPRK